MKVNKTNKRTANKAVLSKYRPEGVQFEISQIKYQFMTAVSCTSKRRSNLT